MSAVKFSRNESDQIYFQILKLEKEREEARKEDILPNVTEEKREAQIKYESEVGLKFVTKLLAHRTRRLRKEQKIEELEELQKAIPIVDAGVGENNENSEANGHPEISSLSPTSPATASVLNECQSNTLKRSVLQHMGANYIPAGGTSEKSTPSATPTPTDPTFPAKVQYPSVFKLLRNVGTFTLKLAPPESCGGPRVIDIQNSMTDRIIMTGTVKSESDIVIQKPSSSDEEDEALISLKLDEHHDEWAVSFADADPVAYLCKPSITKRVSEKHKYELEPGDDYSDQMHFRIMMEETGSRRNPEFVFRLMTTTMVQVATLKLPSAYKEACITIDEGLWPSQKAVFLSIAVFLVWHLIQDRRRKYSMARALIVSSIILAILITVLILTRFEWRRVE